MFLDMNLSKEIMDSYRTCELCTSSPFDVDIQTLTNSHWSMKPQPPVRLPPIVSECCDHFNAFYLDKFKTGRRLSWLTHVGGADLKVLYVNKFLGIQAVFVYVCTPQRGLLTATHNSEDCILMHYNIHCIH
jgi:Cullin family